MSVHHSGISPRVRFTLAALSLGAVAIVAFVVLTFGSRTGASVTGSAKSQVAGQAIPASAGMQNPEELRKQALNKIAGLPLYFEANRGQVDPSVRYVSRSGRYSLFLTDDAAVFSLIGGEFHKGPMPTGFPYKAGGEHEPDRVGGASAPGRLESASASRGTGADGRARELPDRRRKERLASRRPDLRPSAIS